MRCASCPVPGDRPCLGETPRFSAFCDRAAGGDPVHLSHVVNRSAIAERGEAGEPTGKFPPLLSRARNFAGAVASAVASGGKAVDAAEKDRRLAICHSCDQLQDGRCLLCGCVVDWKARLEAWHCPIQKW